jgi:hypothetical protein
MHVGSIREAINAVPFRPFHLRLVDGRELKVRNRDFVLLSNRHLIVVDELDESIKWVEPMLVISLDFIETPPAPPNPLANGPTPP